MKYLGVDWASTKHDFALLDDSGSVIDEWSLPGSFAAITALLDRLRSEGGPDQVRIAMEPGAPLVIDQLLAAGYPVYLINPKQSDRFRDRHTVAGAKDDRLDARVLADALRTDGARLRALEPDSELTEEIRLRDRGRSALVDQRVALGNQLRQSLERFFPAALELGRSMDDRFFLALLRTAPDPISAARIGRATWRRLLASHRIRALDAADVATIFGRAGFPLRPSVLAACRDQVLDLVSLIESLNERIAAADRRIAALLKLHPDHEVSRSLPGLGSSLVARVLGELGERRAHAEHRTAVLAYAGTVPITRRSGKRSSHVSMRRACNRHLQTALLLMARCSLATSRWARAYLAHALERGMRRMAALRVLANKWLKILLAVLRSGRPYDEETYIRRLRERGVVWARSLAHSA